jgi:hypothetical protein
MRHWTLFSQIPHIPPDLWRNIKAESYPVFNEDGNKFPQLRALGVLALVDIHRLSRQLRIRKF